LNYFRKLKLRPVKTLRGAFYFVTLGMEEPYFNSFPKPPKREKKQPKPLQPKPKNTGQSAMFREIWSEREHKCSNCPAWLGDEPNACFFDHQIPKSRGKKYVLMKEDIQLLCFDCHFVKGNGTREQFEARKKL